MKSPLVGHSEGNGKCEYFVKEYQIAYREVNQ